MGPIALDIGKLVGYIELDATGVNKGISQADTAIDQAGKQWSATAAKSSAQVTKSYDSAFSRMASHIRDNRQDWTQVGGAVTTYGAAVTGLGAIAGKVGIEYNTLRQRSVAALTTMTGSAEDANAQMDKLDEFASNSPFARDVFIRAQQQLLGFGEEAERVVPILDAVQNAVAATGGSNADIEELVSIIARVGATSKLTAEDLNQFGHRGVDAATIIGSQMGKTGQQIREEITAGTLDADAALVALTDGMQERFGGAAENVKGTFDGAKDRVVAAFRDIAAGFSEFLVNPSGGGLLVDGFNALADAMRWFEDLPAPIRDTALMLGLVSGPAALVAGSFLLLAPRALDTYDALKRLGALRGISTRLDGIRLNAMYMGDAFRGAETKAGGLRAAIGTGGRAGLSGALSGITRIGGGIVSFFGGPWGLALLGAATAVGFLIKAHQDGKKAAAEYESSLDDLTGAVTDNTRETIAQRLEQDGHLAYYSSIGGDVADLTGAILGEADARERATALLNDQTVMIREAHGEYPVMEGAAASLMRTLDGETEALENGIDALQRKNDALGKNIWSTEQNAKWAERYKREAEGLGVAAEETADNLDEYGNVIDDVTDSTQDAHQATKDLAEAMGRIIDAAYGAIEADIAYEAALDKLTESLKENGETHDITTEKGRANQSALIDFAAQAYATAEANLQNGASLDDVQSSMSTARDEFIRGATQMGYTGAEARAMADDLGLSERAVDGLATEIGALQGKKVTVEVDGTGRSVLAVQNVRDAIAGVKSKTVYVTVIESYNRGRRPAQSRLPWAEADGGIWSGGKKQYADGGIDDQGRYVPRVPQMAGPAYGRTGIEWGEQVTGWEAYISGKPGMESRNAAILATAADRLGYAVTPYANGHINAGTGAAGAAPVSLDGVRIEGRLVADLTNGEAMIEGVLRDRPDIVHDANLEAGRRGYSRLTIGAGA